MGVVAAFHGVAKMRMQAVDMIQQAKRPLLLIGAGANRKDTSEALVSFIAGNAFGSKGANRTRSKGC